MSDLQDFLEKQRIQGIRSAKKALKELDKLIRQDIDLTALDPEKAKAAAQGKIEAIAGYFKILETIAEKSGISFGAEAQQSTSKPMSVEGRIKR